MAGEIATAYIAMVPSFSGFGKEAARQIGPQAKAVGARAGQQAGAAFTESASKESAGWFAQTAKGAIKNVALYGSMYAAIQGVQRGISAVLGDMVGFNAELEQATIGFETLLGSSAAAEKEMAWIKDFAKETPFRYENLVQYSQRLIAMGFDAEQAKGVLQATGDAAAALGGGADSIDRINLALGQMWTKGKIQSQEMLQLTEAGIGAWQILADAYGVSVAEVQDAVTAGLIKATDAVPALIAGMNTKFGGLMAKQSATFTGIVSNIQDTLQQEIADAGVPLFEELKDQAQKFLDALDDPEALKLIHELGTDLATGVKVLSEATTIAWRFRDAIVAVGIAYAASKLLTRVSVGSPLSAATWFSATRAQEAYAAGLRKTTALRAGLTERGAGALAGAGQIVGLAALVNGYQRVAEAGDNATQTAAGFGETIAGGAIAGAAFGSVIPGLGTAAGAAAGAVVGLTTSVWSYSQAAQAANKDTTAVQQALQDLGVDAGLASAALSGVTNKQLEAAGGAGKLIDALKSGTYDEYVAKVKEQADSLQEQADVAHEAIRKMGLAEGWDDIPDKYQDVIDKAKVYNDLLDSLTANGDAFSGSQAEVTSSAYQAAYAMDLQTGSLGTMTEAAWNAVQAQGGLSAEALGTSARMEGLAGVAGYVTQMLTGIPANTPINFSTNASDILQQIVRLQAAAASGSVVGGADGYERHLQGLQDQYTKALNSVSVKLNIPKVPKAPKVSKGSGGKSAASKAVDAAKAAAEEAARQLKADRAAQVQFGDAFGSIMEAALTGDFDEFRDRLQDEITSLTRDGYKKAADALKKNSVALTRAALDYSALTNKLEAATDAYDDLTQSMQDQYNTTRDLITGLGQVTDAQSFDQLAYLLGETTSRATDYQNVLKQLKDQGLSEDLWNQLAQAGPESAGLAQSILAQGQAGIDQLNSLSGSLVDAAESMGSLVADSMYGQGVEAMSAYIEGLKSQSTALENQLQTIANNILKKTAGAITPGNAGYAGISAAPVQQTNEYNLSITAESLGDIKTVQDFIAMLEQAKTSQLVNQAGTVTS